MKKTEYSAIHAVLDEADVDIVLASIKHSEYNDTTVIGEVTDLNLKVKIIDKNFHKQKNYSKEGYKRLGKIENNVTIGRLIEADKFSVAY